MDFPFIKVYFFGNDFLLLNYLYKTAPSEETIGRFAQIVCRRKSGIGSNGVVCIEKGTEQRIRIRFFGADGRTHDIFNDALFCISRYAFDSGLFVNNSLGVETAEGTRTVDAIDSNNFRVVIGPPRDVLEKSELKEFANAEYNKTINISGKTYSVTPIHLEREGLVIFANKIPYSDMKPLAREIPKAYPSHSPTSKAPLPVFTRIMSREDIVVFAWFRKPPVDYSSVAAMGGIAAILNGFCDRDLIVHKNDEEYYLQWSTVNNSVYFTGCPQYVFSGSFYLEDEELTFQN